MVAACGWGWMVFVCATAQYPVSGSTDPLPLLLFRLLLLPFLPLHIASLTRPFTVLSFHHVSFNAAFSLSLTVPGGEALLDLSPVTYARSSHSVLSRFRASSRCLDIFSFSRPSRKQRSSLSRDSPFGARRKLEGGKREMQSRQDNTYHVV